jgi:hypothetical protein
MVNMIDGPPQGMSPLAAYSSQGSQMVWRNEEAPMPGTQVSDEGMQLPHPQFKSKCPHPSINPLRQQALAHSSKTPNHQNIEYRRLGAEPPTESGGPHPSGQGHPQNSMLNGP